MSRMFKIFIGNVNFKTDEQTLREIFEPHLVIEDLVIARDPETGRSRGYGFVMTRDRERGRAAIKEIGKRTIDGRKVYLKEAHGKRGGKKPTYHPGKSRLGRTRTAPRPVGSTGYAAAEDESTVPGGYTGYAGRSQEPDFPSEPDPER